MPDNKKTTPAAEQPINIAVHTIPTDFYAGYDPIVKFRKVEENVATNNKKPENGNATITSSEKIAVDKATAAGGTKLTHPANLFTSGKFLAIGGAVIFVIIVALVGLYYWWQTTSQTPTTIPTPVGNNNVNTTVPTTTVPVSTSTETVVPTTTTEATSTAAAPTTTIVTNNLEFPSQLLADAIDTDSDGISDVAEEEIFKTDPILADTDGDKYPDGLEIDNLYDPNGFSPKKLIDSGNVSEFTNPNFGYKLYYPTNWVMGNVDNDYRQVLFSTLNGENIEIRTEDLAPGQSFADWFSTWAPDQKIGDLTGFSNVFKENGQARNDGLVYYFVDGNNVYIILYHTPNTTVSYRAVIKMMAESFNFSTAAAAAGLEENGLLEAGTASSSANASSSVSTSTQ